MRMRQSLCRTVVSTATMRNIVARKQLKSIINVQKASRKRVGLTNVFLMIILCASGTIVIVIFVQIVHIGADRLRKSKKNADASQAPENDKEALMSNSVLGDEEIFWDLEQRVWT